MSIVDLLCVGGWNFDVFFVVNIVIKAIEDFLDEAEWRKEETRNCVMIKGSASLSHLLFVSLISVTGLSPVLLITSSFSLSLVSWVFYSSCSTFGISDPVNIAWLSKSAVFSLLRLWKLSFRKCGDSKCGNLP